MRLGPGAKLLFSGFFLGDVQEFLFVHQLALNSNLFVYFEFTTGVYRCLESWKSRNSKSHFSRS